MSAPRATPSAMASPLVRGLVVVLACLAVIALVTGCTGRPGTPDKYGDTTERNFIAGCRQEAEGFSNIDEVCRCTYEAVVDNIAFEEFKEVNSRLSDEPGQLPANFLQLKDDCIESESAAG